MERKSKSKSWLQFQRILLTIFSSCLLRCLFLFSRSLLTCSSFRPFFLTISSKAALLDPDDEDDSEPELEPELDDEPLEFELLPDEELPV